MSGAGSRGGRQRRPSTSVSAADLPPEQLEEGDEQRLQIQQVIDALERACGIIPLPEIVVEPASASNSAASSAASSSVTTPASVGSEGCSSVSLVVGGNTPDTDSRSQESVAAGGGTFAAGGSTPEFSRLAGDSGQRVGLYEGRAESAPPREDTASINENRYKEFDMGRARSGSDAQEGSEGLPGNPQEDAEQPMDDEAAAAEGEDEDVPIEDLSNMSSREAIDRILPVYNEAKLPKHYLTAMMVLRSPTLPFETILFHDLEYMRKHLNYHVQKMRIYYADYRDNLEVTSKLKVETNCLSNFCLPHFFRAKAAVEEKVSEMGTEITEDQKTKSEIFISSLNCISPQQHQNLKNFDRLISDKLAVFPQSEVVSSLRGAFATRGRNRILSPNAMAISTFGKSN